MATYAVKLERSRPLELPRHPRAPAPEQFLDWCRSERAAGRPLAVDLFSGAGGLGAGVEAAGWTVVAAVDHDRAALDTHRANFPGEALDVDMANPDQVADLIDRLRPLGIDLVAGGPPCQPFSRAGRAKIQSLVDGGTRDATDPRRELWRSFVQVVLALKPRAVIMENVPDMAISDDLRTIRQIADALESSGYQVDYRLLDAWRFGVPQHRKRFILQARSDKKPSWPTPSDARNTVRDAIGDLPSLEGSTGAREVEYFGEPASALGIALRAGGLPGVVHDHMTRPVRADDREAFQMMSASTLYADLPERLRRYRSDTFNDKYKRLGWDELSRTITAHIAKDGYWYIHPEEPRTLTVREAARMQTFPDSFRFSGTRSDAFRQIGNAVPPFLGEAVARAARPMGRGDRAPESHVRRLRGAIEAWGYARRDVHWWLFPGGRMTPIVAALGALLDTHRMPVEHASRVMPLVSAISTVPREMGALADVQTTPARRLVLEKALRAIEAHGGEDVIDCLLPLMSPSQRSIYGMLVGSTGLVVGAGVATVVAGLYGIDRKELGSGSDVRVALAQLVGVGERAAHRMAAIRAMRERDVAEVLALTTRMGTIVASGSMERVAI